MPDSENFREEIPIKPVETKRDTGKLFLYLMIVITVGTFGVGFWQLSAHIHDPFSLSRLGIDTNQNNNFNTNDNSAEVLKAKDSDHDGLSDYDETYIYRTSPYLPDTDSDGLSDYDEVKAGTDPLCPKGEEKNCYASPTPINTNQPTDQTPVVGGLNIDDLFGPTDTNSASGTEYTPAELRQALIDSGLSKETVDKFTDAELLKIYQETISGGSANTNQAITPEQKTKRDELIKQVQGMTGTELRDFLKKNNFDQKIMDQYDDTTLKQLILQQLQNFGS